MDENKKLLIKLKKYLRAEAKGWDDEEMEFKLMGGVEAIKYAIAILYPRTVEDRELKKTILHYQI